MKKSFIVMSAIVFFAVALTGVAYGMGSHSQGCTIKLVEYEVYTDQSKWKFTGVCPVGMSFELYAMWKGSPEYKAHETIKGTGLAKDVTGSTITKCANDPWLSIPGCDVPKISGNFVKYFKVDPKWRSPVSADALTRIQQQAFLVMAKANGPKLPPTIVKPHSGAIYLLGDGFTEQVTPPPGSPSTFVQFDCQILLSSGKWQDRGACAAYNITHHPSGYLIKPDRIRDRGTWRIRAKMDKPKNAPWSDWVQFKVQ
jgi:hypothetical protein